MTRLNQVPVEEMSDQNLFAEGHEIPRMVKMKVDISDAPDRYCLGKGHVKWGAKHALFVIKRYDAILKEMKYRGFKPNYTTEDLLKYAIEHNKSLLDYEPDENDIKISRDRIIERYKKKPDWWRWTKREKPDYLK